MSELAVIPDLLPETAITVDTVSIPVVVIDAPAEIVVDLGVPSLTRSHHRRPPAPISARAHVALWWSNIQFPIVPPMSIGWRGWIVVVVTGTVGLGTAVVGLLAWSGGWI